MVQTPLPPPLSALEGRLGLPAGTLDEADEHRATLALADATALVLAEIPSGLVDAWRVNAPDVAALVVLKAARREFENPQGLYSETLGERSIGTRETSGVYLTDREVAQIRRAYSKRRAGSFVGSIRIRPATGEP